MQRHAGGLSGSHCSSLEHRVATLAVHLYAKRHCFRRTTTRHFNCFGHVALAASLDKHMVWR